MQPVPKGIYSPYPSSCLASVQFWRPDFPKGIGTFNNYKGQVTKEPSIGAVIITNEGPVGHGGQVISFTSKDVTFRECNYRFDDINKNGVRDKGEEGVCGTRTLAVDSQLIEGYVPR